MIKSFLVAMLIIAILIGISFLIKANIIFGYILLCLMAFSLIWACCHAIISNNGGGGCG